MKDSQYKKLEKLIEYGYPFNFGKYIEQGIDILRTQIWLFAGFTILWFGIFFILLVIPGVNILAMMFLTIPITAGYYIVADKIRKNEQVVLADFFKGFDHFLHLASFNLVLVLFCLGFTLPFFYEVFLKVAADPDSFLLAGKLPEVETWKTLLFIPLMYLYFSWKWAPLFIIFHKMKFWEAMEMSRRLINKNWFIVFSFLFLVSIIGTVGYIILFVGLFFSYPAMHCMEFAAFSDITKGIDEQSPDDEIVNHLIED